MNISTRIDPAPAYVPSKPYLDENGNPSERSGPDLTMAEPIENVIGRLRYARNGYSVDFWQACRASGIDLSVMVDRDGDEWLQMWLPCDDQEDLRRARYDALRAHVMSTTRRRQSVIDLVNMRGRFADNRRFESVEEAAREFVSAGGRIYVLQDGLCEEILPYSEKQMMEEGWSGYPLRRLSQRYDATLRQKGARDELAALVRKHGQLHEGSGAWVWEVRGV